MYTKQVQKTFTVKRILLVLFIVISNFVVWSQVCALPTISKKEYCPGQNANIVIADAATNVKYYWYETVTADIGSYGTDGNGKNFISSATQNAVADFHYIKETSSKIGPDYTLPVGGTTIVNNGVNKYEQTFNTSLDFELSSITIIAKLTSATANYGFNVRHISTTGVETYSNWYTAQRSTFTSLGSDLYRITIPVTGINVFAGNNQKIEVISDTDTQAGSRVKAEELYWYPGTQFNGATYNGTVTMEDPGKTIATVERTPLLMDWDVVYKCPKTTVSTILAAECCIPVGDAFSITSPFASPTNDQFPLTLTASGVDINNSMNYYWYNEAGTLLASGLGKNTYQATSKGQYTVKVVRNATDATKSACYNQKSILLNIRSIFAPDDFTVCLGEPISLRANGSEGSYTWSSLNKKANDAIKSPNNQTTDFNIDVAGIYALKVEGDVNLGELVKDGEFEKFSITNPFAFFNSQYTNISTNLKSNSQFVVENRIFAYDTPQCTDPSYFQKTDPTTNAVNSRGKVLYADPPSTGTAVANTAAYALEKFLWQQSAMPLEKNQTYSFSMDLSSWNNTVTAATSPVIMVLVNGTPLNLSVNGVDVGTTYAFSGSVCTWKTITATWNSGNATNGELTIAEISKIDKGYELAMDDITFSTGRGKQSDEVIVTVQDCNEFEVLANQTVCLGAPVTLNTVKNTGFFKEWKDPNGTVVSTTESVQVYPTSTGDYTARTQYPVLSLIKNGNFEADAPLDFTTQMTPIPANNTSLNNGEYFIGSGTDTRFNEYMAKNFADHTATVGSDKMMIAWLRNGATNNTVISKTFAVTNGTSYGFSSFFKHNHKVPTGTNASDYTFELLLGTTVVKTFVLPKGSGWTEFSYSWTATTTENTTLTLRSNFTNNSGQNGVAIDDIKLNQLGTQATDNLTITVKNCTTLDLTDLGCFETIKKVKAVSNGVFKGWYNNLGTLISDNNTLSVTPTTTETYSAVASVSLGTMNQNSSFTDNGTGFTFTGNLGTDAIPRPNNYLFTTNSNTLKELDNINNIALNLNDSQGAGGKYLVVSPNGDATNYTLVNTSAISVTANTTYAIGFNFAYIKNGAPVKPPLKLYAGNTLIATFTPIVNNDWQTFSATYTPTTNASTVFSIRVDNTNDYNKTVNLIYAIDNFKVAPTVDAVSANISLAPCAPAAIDVDTTLCSSVATNISLATFENKMTDGGKSIASGWFNSISDANANTSPIAVTTGLSPINGQKYYLRTTDAVSGNGVATLTFTLTTSPAAPSTKNFKLCLNEAINARAITDSITKAATGTLTWYTNGTNTVITQPTLLSTPAGTRTFELTQTVNACPSPKAAISIIVNALPTVTATSDETDNTLCAGENVVLTGTGATSYTWDNSVINATAFVPTATTIYTVTGKDANGCTNTATSTVTVNPTPSATISGSGSVCADGSDNQIVTITTTNATFPATVVVTRNVGGDTSLILSTSNATINSKIANTFALASVSSANGCTAKAIDLTGSAAILSVAVPVANLISANTQTNFGTRSYKEHLTADSRVDVVANALTTGYVGSWLLTGQGTKSASTDNTIAITDLLTPSIFPDTAYGKPGVSQLIWSVKDNADICDAATDTIKIVKVSRGISNAGANTSICIDKLPFTRTAQTPLPVLETTYWIDVDGAFNAPNTKINNVTLTIPNTVAKGSYTFKYLIENTKYPTPSESFFVLTIDELPSDATVASTTIKTCDITANLNAIAPTTGTGIWKKVSGTGTVTPADLSKPEANVTGLLSGESGIFRWITSNGACVNKDSVDVTITKAGSLTPATVKVNGVEIANKDTAFICISALNKTISNAGFVTATETGIWDIVSGTSITLLENNSGSQTMTLNNAGTTELTWTVSDASGSGCNPNTRKIYVTVVNEATVDIVSITENTICQGEKVTAIVTSSNAVGSPVWNTGSATISATSGLNTGEFMLQTTAATLEGEKNVSISVSNPTCGIATDNGKFFVNKVYNPQFDITPIPTQCEKNKVLFTLSNTRDLLGATYAWSYTGPGIAGVATGNTFEVSDLIQTTTAEVKLKVVSGYTCNLMGAVLKDSIPVTVKKAPKPALSIASLDTTICENSFINIFTSDLEPSLSDFQWYKNGTKLIGETKSSLLNVNSSGIYYMTETDKGICASVNTESLKLQVDVIPTVNAGNDIEIFEQENTSLNGLVSVGVYNWNTLQTTNKANSDIVLDKNNLKSELISLEGTGGFYEIELSSTNGKCKNSDILKVVIKKKLRVPNAFTVNGDGINETFVIDGIDTYPYATVSIFNRWGNIVFTAKNNYAENPWDGGSLPEGVYYYLIDTSSEDKKVSAHTGVIHLLR